MVRLEEGKKLFAVFSKTTPVAGGHIPPLCCFLYYNALDLPFFCSAFEGCGSMKAPALPHTVSLPKVINSPEIVRYRDCLAAKSILNAGGSDAAALRNRDLQNHHQGANADKNAAYQRLRRKLFVQEYKGQPQSYYNT